MAPAAGSLPMKAQLNRIQAAPMNNQLYRKEVAPISSSFVSNAANSKEAIFAASRAKSYARIAVLSKTLLVVRCFSVSTQRQAQNRVSYNASYHHIIAVR